METVIYLSLTDDWELRGNGSGDIERIQFRPMRKLVKIYNRHNVRSTFNAEVMQQLTFRKFERQFPELGTLADTWDHHVREAFREGHDIQLHLHPQWTEAVYETGRWRLSGDWSILNYDEDAAFELLGRGREYLENLLRPLDSSYRCVSFRAGSSIIAPSPFILGTLVRLGIKLDMSIVGGLYHDTRHVHIDYREAEEDFLPFYPRMTDARKVSDREEEIVCVPVQHFQASRRQFVRTLASYAARRARLRKGSSSGQTQEGESNDAYGGEDWAEKRHASKFLRVYEKAVLPCLQGWHRTADLSRLNYSLMREMLDSIRRRARQTGLAQLPVILANHSKDIKDFDAIERFVSEAAHAPDIKFLTQTEMVAKLERGEFQIRKATSETAQAGRL